jgi:thymidylate synthase
MEYNLETIEATTLSDAWFMTIYKCIEEGRPFTIDRGSYAGQKRLEFDYITIQIKHPEIRVQSSLLPKVPEQFPMPDPVSEDYLASYVPYLMTGAEQPGESYTYGQRLTKFPVSEDWVKRHASSPFLDKILIREEGAWCNSNIISAEEDCDVMKYYLNQMELVIWTYKNKGYRNNQMTMQVAMPSDMLLQDPPCLRSIDTRIQDDKLIFIVYFRSWDLWGGFPANLAAIQLMKEYMAGEIGIEPGQTVASSKGLHIYDYTFELAECVRGKTIEEFREG